jgi:hypothetical protein
MDLPYAAAAAVTGSRTDDGLRSTLYHVIIVVEPGKLVEHEMGALADYIALLALSQVQLPERCQNLPSIVNLLPPGCEGQTGMTAADIGYLRGLYHMNAAQMLSGQQNHIAYQMQQSLTGH